MLKISGDILELIGNTPLISLGKIGKGLPGMIYGKLESANPGGSVKDRIAKGMIEDAEKKGALKKGMTVVEPTSGNTGIGLAMVAAVKGYKIILVMPDSLSVERQSLLKAYGAELVLTPGSGGMKGAIEKAEEIVAGDKSTFMPQQFNNQANPDAHRKTTALELWEQTDGKIDILVAGVGTGGTITGVSEVIKKKKPDFRAIAVEPVDSAVLSGEKPGPHKIQGIGAGFVPKVLNTDVYSEIIKVKADDAFNMARRLAKEEGILTGISAGANVFAAVEVAKRKENKGKTIVTILCDTGERYLSTELFSE